MRSRARLLRGEGPSARRLRHLAATLPVGASRRGSRAVRFVVERRRINVNLRCARVAGRGRDVALWRLGRIPRSPRAPRASRLPPDPLTVATLRRLEEDPRRRCGGPPPLNSRFLWTLDEDGAFWRGPSRARRCGRRKRAASRQVRRGPARAAPNVDGGGELVRALAARQTFSRRSGRLAASEGSDRRRLVTLSAAPLFGRRREFLGYRGFGVLGEEIEAELSNGGGSGAGACGGRSQPDAVAGAEPIAPQANQNHPAARRRRDRARIDGSSRVTNLQRHPSSCRKTKAADALEGDFPQADGSADAEPPAIPTMRKTKPSRTTALRRAS